MKGRKEGAVIYLIVDEDSLFAIRFDRQTSLLCDYQLGWRKVACKLTCQGHHDLLGGCLRHLSLQVRRHIGCDVSADVGELERE